MINVMLKCLKKAKNIKIQPWKKECEHKASGYSIFTQCSFDITKNKLDCYRAKDCMERFCKDLKKHAAKIIMKKEK